MFFTKRGEIDGLLPLWTPIYLVCGGVKGPYDSIWTALSHAQTLCTDSPELTQAGVFYQDTTGKSRYCCIYFASDQTAH